jgi:ketosteroid isomerase-like protein
MSAENIELVRTSIEAFTERGIPGMEPFWAPDITWRAIEGAPDDVGEMHGVDAVRRYFQDWDETFDDLTLALLDSQDEGDQVVATQLVTGRAKLSGAETEIRYSVVYTVRGGRIASAREYLTLEEALAAVGRPAPNASASPRRSASAPSLPPG